MRVSEGAEAFFQQSHRSLLFKRFRWWITAKTSLPSMLLA
ncbi:hypothetical protein SCH4B_4208 [Ruegeria sp. TrichCH4B]|nr:hypothetical protein SCH4B_4208 [Ruegeria sp. TrichCH4B]